MLTTKVIRRLYTVRSADEIRFSEMRKILDTSIKQMDSKIDTTVSFTGMYLRQLDNKLNTYALFVDNSIKQVNDKVNMLNKVFIVLFSGVASAGLIGYNMLDSKMDNRFIHFENKMDSRFIHFENKMEKRFEKVEAEVAAVKTEVAAVKTEVAAVKTEVAAVKTEVQDMKKSIDNLADILIRMEKRRRWF